MKISTRGRYALRFMIDLALHDTGGYTTLRDVSSRQNISVKYLEQITALLSKNSLLSSVRGPQGGYKLSKGADKYTVGEILRITEGDLVPVSCLETQENTCSRRDICPTLKMWKGFYKLVNDYFDGIYLSDLVKNAHEEPIFDYVI